MICGRCKARFLLRETCLAQRFDLINGESEKNGENSSSPKKSGTYEFSAIISSGAPSLNYRRDIILGSKKLIEIFSVFLLVLVNGKF